MPITVDIDVMLARRKMSVGELAERVGITPANLAVLKNGRAKAVRFTTLAALCEVLECQPGDLLRWEAEGGSGSGAEGGSGSGAEGGSGSGAEGGSGAEADTAAEIASNG
ncbi:helix-turn-helix transcriptional regulator [Streptomyces sp. NBC_01353]|nr:helix-turn-helix transcriptional regulator [Streptomyces sp. NBC_01353]